MSFARGSGMGAVIVWRYNRPSLPTRQGRAPSEVSIITSGASGDGVSSGDAGGRSILQPRPAQVHTPPEAGPRPRVHGTRRLAAERPRLAPARRPPVRGRPVPQYQWIPEPLPVPRAAGQALRD